MTAGTDMPSLQAASCAMSTTWQLSPWHPGLSLAQSALGTAACFASMKLILADILCPHPAQPCAVNKFACHDCMQLVEYDRSSG